MGNLLGAPITTKETHTGRTNGGLPFGVSSMQGWRVHMEDAHITEGRLYAAEKGEGDGNSLRKIFLPGHSLFGVFDGHGGSFAALYAGRNLCRILSRQAKFVEYAKLMQQRGQKLNEQQNQKLIALLEGALRDAFVDLDREIAMSLKGQKVVDADQPYHDEAEDPNGMDDGVRAEGDPEAGDKMDVANSSAQKSETALQIVEDEGDSGTTACVVLLTPDFVICANAGDSRAVISKKGNVAPLSYDHKPDDEGEERRIRAAGGYVAGGRVEGDLAVSRGLGDFRFKVLDVVMQGSSIFDNSNDVNGSAVPSPSLGTRRPTAPGDQKVSPIPDMIVHQRNLAEDEFIIVACDGIWDVQTNETAAQLVSNLFREGEKDLGLISEEMCDMCLRLGSKDNMTVLIVQFAGQSSGAGGGVIARREAREAETARRQASAS